MRKLLCYGDSNTYGYDPADYLGGRYPLEQIWTSLLSEMLGPGWQVINQGMNGRQIPCGPVGFSYLETLLKKLDRSDLLAVMLGTNDILMTDRPDAGAAILKMDALLDWLSSRHPAENTILISPAQVGREDGPNALYLRFRSEIRKMNDGFKLLAEQRGVLFADASLWDVDLASDLDHFSELGHRQFAQELLQVLRNENIIDS